MANKDKEGLAFPDGIITKPELKRRTGQFDLESIFQLDVSGQSLHGLGCLPECASLEFLDLSNNQLVDVSQLGNLKCLRYLNLSNNRLSNLNGLDGCEALVEVKLAGNLISCTEDLHSLASLEHLESVQLQDKATSSNSNPLCLSASYVAKVTSLLPGIADLDGDKIRGAGESYYHLCQQVDRALAGDISDYCTPIDSRPKPKGLGNSYWSIQPANEEQRAAAAAEAEFKQILQRIRDQELRALLCIEECERDLRKKQQ